MAFSRSAKGTAVCRQSVKKLAGASGGALDAVSVFRVPSGRAFVISCRLGFVFFQCARFCSVKRPALSRAL